MPTIQKHHQLSYHQSVYAARHSAEKFGAIFALHIWFILLGDILMMYSVRREPHAAKVNWKYKPPKKRCCLRDGRRTPFVSRVWNRESWNRVSGRPNTEDDAAKQNAPFKDHLWTSSPLDSSPKPKRKKCCKIGRVVQRPPWTKARWTRVRGRLKTFALSQNVFETATGCDPTTSRRHRR